MNENILNAVIKIEKIQERMSKDYQWENIEHIMIDEIQYFYSDWEDGEGVPLERTLSDRHAMLEVLRDFYKENSSTHEGRDNFVTLFGIYCNHYIRYNLHNAIQDDHDFGVHELFDDINDVKFQKYLLLLQQGISKGIQSTYEDDANDGISYFIDADYLLDEDYSLHNLYLFIYAFKYMDKVNEIIDKDEDCIKLREYMVDCFDAMNHDMQKYVLGESKYNITQNIGMNVDPNPLPYIKYKNEFEYDCSKLLYKIVDSIETLQDTSSSEVSKQIAGHSINEAMEGFYNIKQNQHYNESSIYEVPAEWRDDDGILYRLQFLSIPCIINSNRSLSTIINNLTDVKRLNERNESLIQDKQNMIRKFSHDFGNLETDTLHYMATTLLSAKDESLRLYGKQMLVEYVNKQDIIRSVYLLRLEFLDETQKMVDLIRQGITKCSSGNLNYLLDKAWERGFIRVLYTNNPLLNTEWGNKIINLQKEIENEAFLGNIGITNWVLKTFNFNINISNEWKQIYFVSDERDKNAEDYLGRKPRADDGYGRIFFVNMFSELFYNLLKYANWEQPIFLSLGYDYNEKKYWIKINNSKSSADFHESKNGMITLDKTLTRINNESGYNVSSSIIVVDNVDTYQVTISLAAFLLKGGM